MKTNVMLALILLGMFLYFSQQDTTIIIDEPDEPSVDLADLVDADVSFTGVNKYVGSTSLSGEYVRVFRFDGTRTDLGTTSLNSGALSVKPKAEYKLYFFMNDTGPTVDYYVDVQDYTGKVQDAVDNVVGYGCEIDTNPLITVRTNAGQTQTSTSNAQAVSASTDVDIELDITTSSDKCYGTPGAPKGNAICFSYSSTYFTNIKPNTNWITVPRSIASLGETTVKCYEFSLLEDGAKDTLTVSLQPTSSEPTISHNISIFTDDIGFDLHATTLAEIWDYTDEDGNQLARIINATPDGYIYIS